MEFGLGLPISAPARLLDWARAAEACGFDTLALLDRLAFDNPEPLTALAVLAGATGRIRLQTEVLLGPLRQTALLAKQVATLHRMSGGRFVLGIGVGGREDDHAAAGVPIARRGRMLDEQLVALKEIWRGDLIGPRPVADPPILIGGFAPAALQRVARHADGFICAAPASWAGGLIHSVREQWAEAGRPGAPRIVCQVNVAVGARETIADARRAVAEYYAFTGRAGWGAPLTEPAQIAEAVAEYAALGADEVVFYCYGADPAQVEAIAHLLRSGPGAG
ncbi:LLM class flavin-dependent oxidoreductase [Actinoplanes sp. KI2]|uniref:LLM class flavin-dependent oxidoreductase n=1 Tax=Actinoplanes sp. KI2 TaxID=2983315 RepID=UPI0021D58128|nr:LLM class flavin-dependent oxidoreductase [Actinoplanes sp. KI2]MCU7729005.1 LLM class flavin-dependent oxidoreductase [Actinoplanes sp. KI2]